MSFKRFNTLLKQSGENPQGPLLRLIFCLLSAQLDAKYTSLLVVCLIWGRNWTKVIFKPGSTHRVVCSWTRHLSKPKFLKNEGNTMYLTILL